MNNLAGVELERFRRCALVNFVSSAMTSASCKDVGEGIASADAADARLRSDGVLSGVMRNFLCPFPECTDMDDVCDIVSRSRTSKSACYPARAHIPDPAEFGLTNPVPSIVSSECDISAI